LKDGSIEQSWMENTGLQLMFHRQRRLSQGLKVTKQKRVIKHLKLAYPLQIQLILHHPGSPAKRFTFLSRKQTNTFTQVTITWIEQY